MLPFYLHGHRQHDFMAPTLEGCPVVVFLPAESSNKTKQPPDLMSSAFRIYTPGPRVLSASWRSYFSDLSICTDSHYTKLPDNFQDLAGVCLVSVCHGVMWIGPSVLI